MQRAGPIEHTAANQKHVCSTVRGMLTSFVAIALLEVSARKVPDRTLRRGGCDGSEGRHAGRCGRGGRGCVRSRTSRRAARQTVREGEDCRGPEVRVSGASDIRGVLFHLNVHILRRLLFSGEPP